MRCDANATAGLWMEVKMRAVLRGMWSRRRGSAVLLLLACLAGPAWAGLSSGTGPLNDVDPDAGTVEIRDDTFAVDAMSILLDDRGERLNMVQLEEVSAPWVIFRTRPGYPRRIIEALQLIDEDADEVDESLDPKRVD